MLTTRLWMGGLLVLVAVGVLVVDEWLRPWFPVLLATVLAAAIAACYELVNLLPRPRPRLWFCYAAVVTIVLANWLPHVGGAYGWNLGGPWHWVLGATVAALLAAFLVEASYFNEPGGAVIRLSLAFAIICYVGLLASFCVQPRWLPGSHGPLALALIIFVPKSGDIGAYFMGRVLGRHRMAPVLSPKKTWEGAAGGLLASMLVALGINGLGARFSEGALMSWPSAAGFGLAVGALGQLGDLMESLIKRDSQRKDASTVVPGFGGVLDVLDSILFSAPLAYLWITLNVRTLVP